ncbi:oligosaccharide reducing-end xylanase [Paenibacillus sp. PastF-3]|uniref:glycosyl hydrolase family 8 n=1 Tax=Paenibacillus sp. PastF-3 TaxID=2940626 RepID=UPI002476BAA6|nr:glycosyl hydrolase family 8 [Paenibacillus sp. PastF-3]MDH6368761.1 oligosaccharide reducing-end xylanase [Paenibacillus sp. PastF-3]
MSITQQGAFYTGEYRNLFKELGFSEDEINAKIDITWNDLFYGDPNVRIYYPQDENKSYILDTGNLDVRSEGMSYGMMMAVQMNKKDEFDRLWNFSKTFMQHKEGRYANYFAWHCKPDGTRISHGPAPDGEEFFAMALFFASKRWGNGLEPYNYSEQARTILRACVHKTEIGAGDSMWDAETKLIKFVPEATFSDPSYHLPHFYDLFALWADEDDHMFWREAAEASRTYLHTTCHPITGLAPEYANFNGTPAEPQPHGDFSHFFSDAYRVAANIGLDWAWFQKDSWQVDQCNRIQAFFRNIEVSDYRRYTIEGQPFDELALHPVGLLATNAMASLASNAPEAEHFVRLFWNTPLRTGQRRYYDNCLYFFSLLALSGNYRIY